MIPAGHVARIGWVEGACAGEPTQHASAHLLLHRGEVFGCWRTGLGEMDLAVLAQRKHPVDHAAVEVDMGVPRGAEALLHKLTAPSRPSMTRSKMCSTAARAPRDRVAGSSAGASEPTTPTDGPAAAGRRGRPNARRFLPCAVRCMRGTPRAPCKKTRSENRARTPRTEPGRSRGLVHTTPPRDARYPFGQKGSPVWRR